MSIGLALLLIFAVYLIAKAFSWRTAFTVVGVMLGVLAIGFGIFTEYAMYTDAQSRKQEQRQQAEQEYQEKVRIQDCTRRGGQIVLSGCYIPPTPEESARANQIEHARVAKQAAEVAARRARALAEAQRVFAAKVDSVFWKTVYRLPEGIDETLNCKAHRDISIGEYMFVNGNTTVT